MLGTEKIDADVAFDVINKWMSKGYSFKMLHLLCKEAAKSSGFFIDEEEIAIMGQMADQNENALKLVLPLIQEEMGGMIDQIQGMMK